MPPTTFRRAVTRSMLLSALVPLAILAVAGWFGIERLQLETLARENAAHARAVEAHVTGYMGRIETLAITYTDSSYTQLLQANMFERLWQQRVDIIEPLESMTMLDDTGVTVSSVIATGYPIGSGVLVGLDHSRQEEYLRAVQSGQPTWSDVHASPVSGEPAVSYVFPMRSGVIILEVTIGRLGEVVATEPGITPLVVDRHGVVLYHPDDDIVALKPSLANNEFIQEAQAGRPSESYDFEMDGRHYLASAEPLPGTGWIAISLDAQESVRSAVLQARIVAGSVMVVGGLFALLLSFALAANLARPFSSLVERVGELAKGKYDLPPQSYALQEIDVLSSALQDMSQAAHDREEQVAATAEQYRYLVESLQAVPYEFDYDEDRFTYVGPQAVGLLGYPIEEWTDIGSWERMIHPEDRDAAVSICVAASGERLNHQLSYRMITSGGETLTIHDVVSVQTQPDGGTHVVGVLLDVTTATAARELKAAAELAHAANAAKSSFLAYMSHELRTPLNSIIGFSQIMLDGISGDFSEEQRRQVGIIRRSGEHLMTLVNNILDLEKIERGALGVDLSDVVMTSLVRSAIEEVAPLAGIQSLAYELHLPDELPIIRSDEDKLRQIMLNLLSNAIKYTEPGGHLDVTLEIAHDKTLRVLVADTGVGIPAELLEEIFDEFRCIGRVGPAMQASTGLGLAISRRLARLLRGDILVSSEVGRGSVFTLEIPIDAFAEGDDAATASTDERN